VNKLIEKEIANLYIATKQNHDGKVDKAVETKIQNSSMLQLIEEAEYVLNKYNEEFEYIQNYMKDGNFVFKKDFDKTAKDLKKKNIGEYREKNKKFEEEKLKAYQL